MQLLKFLNAISTPQVETQSLHHAFGKPAGGEDGLCRCDRRGQGHGGMKKVFSLHGRDGQLLGVEPPYYVDKKAKVLDRSAKCSCHGYKDQNGSGKVLEFMKKGVGGLTTLDIRKKMGKQKREYIRNYERHTYQPPKTTQTGCDTLNLRKQLAQAQFIHKFCNMFNIPCTGCKCKLDCVNASFEQFLKKSDLCILKGLNRIIGRGANLDAEIKAEIMDIYADRHHRDSLENILAAVKLKLNGKLDKHLERRYMAWAKEIMGIVSKIEKEQQRKEKKRETVHAINQTMELNVTENGKTFIYAGKNKRGRKKMNEVHSMMKAREKETGKDERGGRKGRLKGKSPNQTSQMLSIRGSQMSSQAGSPHPKIQSSESEKESGFAPIQKKPKPRLLKYSSINHSSKRKLKSLTPHHKNNEFKNELSRFFQQEDLLGNEKEKEGKHVRILLQKQNGQCYRNSLSSLDDEAEECIEDRLNTFGKLLSRIDIQVGQDQGEQELQQQVEQQRKEKTLKQFSPTQRAILVKADHKQLLTNLKRKRELFRKSRHTNVRKSSINANMLSMSIKKSKLTIDYSLDIENSNPNGDASNAKGKNGKALQSEKSIRSKKKIKKNINKISGFNDRAQAILDCSKPDPKKSLEQANIKSIMLQISSTTNLIEKVQRALAGLGLESAIIYQTDSLFTQKRKIRHIRERVQNYLVGHTRDDILKYLDIFIRRIKFKKYCKFMQGCVEQNLSDTEEDELNNALRKYRDLKFYQLKDTYVCVPTKREAQPRSQFELKSVESSLRELKKAPQEPSQNLKKFLGPLQTFITEKEHTPFDFYHYLQLGNNLALRKYYMETGCSFKGEESKQSKILDQKQMQNDEEATNPYSQLY